MVIEGVFLFVIYKTLRSIMDIIINLLLNFIYLYEV